MANVIENHALFVCHIRKNQYLCTRNRKTAIFMLNELKQKLLQFQTKLNVKLNTKEL